MYAKYKPARPISADQDILNQINEKGYYLQENFVSEQQVKLIRDEVESAYKNLKEEDHSDFFCKEGGHERIGNIDSHSPLAKAYFYENELINRLAKTYVSKDAKAYRKEADYKYEIEVDYQANIAHFDDWRHRFKAFLFLNDVGPDNAPMIYFEGSHKKASWRKEYEKDYIIHGPKGRYGHFFPQEMMHLQSEQNFKPIRLESKAGTLFLGDFRGIHQGTRLKAGKRILLNCTFGL